MTTGYRNLTTTCLAAVLAFGLAACGGGSSTTPEPTAEELRMQAQMECEDAGGRFETDGSCTSAEDLAEEARQAGIIEGMRQACLADDGRWNADNTCTSAADVLAEMETACEAAGGRWNDDDTCTDSAGLMMEATTAAAGTKAAAIRAEQAQTIEVGIGGDAAIAGPDGDATATGDNVANPNSYTIERDSDGTTVEVTDTRMDGDDDPKYEDQMAGLDGRTMFVRTMKADDDGNVVKEVVMVGTDIAAPKAVEFEKFELAVISSDGTTRTVTTPQELNIDLDPTMDADNDGTATNDLTARSVGADGTTAPNANDLAAVMSDSFVSGDGTMTVLTFARYQEDSDTGTDGAQTIEAFMTMGHYNGAMGMYKCNAPDSGGSDCTVTLNDKGEISAMSAGWVFIPAEGATSDQPDYQYTSYGFWLMNTTDEDGVLKYNEVETFAMAHGYTTTTTDGVGAVTGTADYSGSAVGVYVKNVTDTEGGVVSATSGHFVADVALAATFGGPAVAANDHFTIGGSITDFDLSGGEANDWSVSLGLVDFSGRGAGAEPGESPPGTAFATMFSGMATGDAAAAAGNWNGMFHGTAGQIDHDSDSNTAAINTAPGAVTGEFNANFTDGTVAGGFGAEEDM